MKITKVLAGMVFLVSACYPGGPEYVDEYDLVYSNYDKDYGFGSKSTFAMPDKVVKIDKDLVEGNGINYIKDVHASVMLNTIRQNMVDAGWTEADIESSPDVLLAPAAYEISTYYVNDWWHYWNWWWGGYYPGWGGWYYPYPVVSGYTTGSLFVAMVDTQDVSADDRPKVVWNFVINGLLQGSTSSFNTRVEKGITQAFTQSPYLLKN